MKKLLYLTLKLVVVALVLFLTLGTSCITTGNVMVVEYLGDLNGQTDATFTKVEVNLRNNSDWTEHKDQLNSVDDIGFACKIKNNESSIATGQIYISEKPGAPGTLPTGAIKILDGIKVSANSTREITWGESYDFLSNFDEAKKIVYTEHFYLFFIVAETPFNIDVTNITLFLSVNGKP